MLFYWYKMWRLYRCACLIKIYLWNRLFNKSNTSGLLNVAFNVWCVCCGICWQCRRYWLMQCLSELVFTCRIASKLMCFHCMIKPSAARAHNLWIQVVICTVTSKENSCVAERSRLTKRVLFSQFYQQKKLTSDRSKPSQKLHMIHFGHQSVPKRPKHHQTVHTTWRYTSLKHPTFPCISGSKDDPIYQNYQCTTALHTVCGRSERTGGILPSGSMSGTMVVWKQEKCSESVWCGLERHGFNYNWLPDTVYNCKCVCVYVYDYCQQSQNSGVCARRLWCKCCLWMFDIFVMINLLHNISLLYTH